MQVKKYIAQDMQEAVKMIKEELGSKAVILSTRKVRKGQGAFGLFGKYVLEVTAAKDDKPAKSLPAVTHKSQGMSEYEREIRFNAPAAPRPAAEKTPAWNGPARGANYPGIKEDITELKDILMELRKGVRRELNDEANVHHLRYELHELKHMIGSLITESSELRDSNLHENLVALYQQLVFNGVEAKFAKKLCDEVQRKVPKSELGNYAYVKIYLARMFMQVLNIHPGPADNIDQRPKVVSFVGPTGVGKTTTLAKVCAAERMRNPNLKIGLITMDTYRIGAVQQLKAYAQIIKVPIKVVSSPEEFKDAINGYREMDLVLVDTAGRSQRDEMQMSELREFLGVGQDFTNLLVLSSTTKDGDLLEITKRFSTAKLDGVIFTKLDESTSYGSIFNHAIRFKLPLAYLTTGQNVPEDIEQASRERLIDLLLNIAGDEEAALAPE